jgi:hypothetical protein
MLFNCQLNESDKKGLSTCLGFDYSSYSFPTTAIASSNTTTALSVPAITNNGASSTMCHLINANTTLGGLTFDYAIPLCGILGSGTDKMFPIGSIYGLRFELTMDSYANFTKLFLGTSQVSGCIISDVEFVANIIELSPESQSLIEMANPQKMHIRSQSFRQASNALASTASGTNDLLVGIRVSSLKSIYLVSSTTTAPEGKYAGINPNLDQGTCFIIAGQNYPQRTINPSFHPSDCYMELQKSFGALNLNVFNGSMGKTGYYTSATAVGLCVAFNTSVASILSNPNQFYLGIDTEVVARKTNLLSGINVNSAPMFFRAQVNTATGVAMTLNFFGFYDLILEVDVQAKNIIAKF